MKGNSANSTNLSSTSQHAKRAIFQATYVWGLTLLRAPELSDPSDLGWTKRTSGMWEPLWTTLPEACKSYQELIKCGCNEIKDAVVDANMSRQGLHVQHNVNAMRIVNAPLSARSA